MVSCSTPCFRSDAHSLDGGHAPPRRDGSRSAAGYHAQVGTSIVFAAQSSIARDRVEVQTADARKLPFEDASFDVVLSSAALHNIYNAGERRTAVREIARVLKIGGRVLIVDVRHIRYYARTLREAGFDEEKDAARSVQGIVSHLLTILTFGLVQVGYVIGSKAR